jgi:hypothetical protein
MAPQRRVMTSSPSVPATSTAARPQSKNQPEEIDEHLPGPLLLLERGFDDAITKIAVWQDVGRERSRVRNVIGKDAEGCPETAPPNTYDPAVSTMHGKLDATPRHCSHGNIACIPRFTQRRTVLPLFPYRLRKLTHRGYGAKSRGNGTREKLPCRHFLILRARAAENS